MVIVFVSLAIIKLNTFIKTCLGYDDGKTFIPCFIVNFLTKDIENIITSKEMESDTFKNLTTREKRQIAIDEKNKRNLENWKELQKVREETNIHQQRAKQYRNVVGIFTDHSSLNSTTHTAVNDYVTALNTFADNNPNVQEWKFNGNTPVNGSMPVLNVDAKKEIQTLINRLGLPLLPEEI